MRLFITIGFSLCISSLYAQQSIVLNKAQDKSITIDHLNQKYVITEQSLLKEERGETRIFQHPFLGRLSHLDVRNPLELVLFFDESNQMLVLDNQLSEKFSLNFNLQFPEIDPVYVASASKNFYWVVDGISKQVYYLDYGSKSIRLISNPILYENHLMYSDANWLYWIDDQKMMQINMYGVTKEYSFNFFYQKIISFTGNQLIFERNGKKYSYNIQSEKEIFIEDFNEGDIK